MALSTKFATFALSENPDTVVPVDHVISADTKNISALPNQPASSAEYSIFFQLAYPGTAPIEIKYGDNKSQRDTDLAAFLAATAQVI